MKQENDLITKENNVWTREQLDLIKSTCARGASDDELKLFLYRCKNLGLDPLKPGQIYFIKYGSSPGTVVVGVDGFRSRAARTGKLSGIKRGAIRDGDGRLVGAFAEVFRSDWKECAREEVPLVEYSTGKGMWQKMPETMIKKVAECAALRMAFADELGGVYAPEEMDQADQQKRVSVQQPEEGDGVTTDAVYKFRFGQYAGKTLEQIYNDPHPKCGPNGMASYVAYLDEQEKKKPLSAGAIEARQVICDFLGAMENAPVSQE